MAFEGVNLTNSDYIPQFTGLPLQALEAVGDTLANRHYENIARARQLELLGLQQKANSQSDADRAYIDQQLGSVQASLEEMAKSGAENSTSKVAMLANRFMGDEGLINIQKTIEAQNREKAIAEQLRASGKTPIFNQRYIDQFSQRGTFNPESGKWEPYSPTVQAQLDYLAAQDTVVDPLQANTYQTDLVGDVKTTLDKLGVTLPPGKGQGMDLSKIPAYLRTQIVERLSKDRVDQFIDKQGGWENYKSTDEYAQQKNVLGLSDQEIKTQLRARGYARTFEKVRNDWERNFAFDLALAKSGKDDKDTPQQPIGEQLPNEPIKFKSPLGDADDFEYKDRTGVGYIDPNNPNAVTGGHSTFYNIKNGQAPGISQERQRAFQRYAKLGYEIFGQGDKDLSDQTKLDAWFKTNDPLQYAKQYEQFVKDRQIFNVNDVTFTVREGEEGRSNAADITTDVKNALAAGSRAVYDVATKKLIPVHDKNQEEYSDDFQDLIGDPNNIRIVGSLDPKNYLAKDLNNPAFVDPYIGIVEDPKDPGKTRTVYITRRKYDKPTGRAIKAQAVNKIYSTVNIEPGTEKEIEIGGHRIKAQELIGNQLNSLFNELDDASKQVVMQYSMPIMATIPGQATPQIFNGPDHLADYLLTLKK
jgi:hypothetical protein